MKHNHRYHYNTTASPSVVIIETRTEETMDHRPRYHYDTPASASVVIVECGTREIMNPSPRYHYDTTASASSVSDAASNSPSLSLLHPQFVYDNDDDSILYQEKEDSHEYSFDTHYENHEASFRRKGTAAARFSNLLWRQCGVMDSIQMDDDDNDDDEAPPPPQTAREWLTFLTSKLVKGCVQEDRFQAPDESPPRGYPTDDSSSDSSDEHNSSSPEYHQGQPRSSRRQSTTTATRRRRNQSEPKQKSRSSRRARTCFPLDPSGEPLYRRPTRRALA
jgi:hypothetical protein